MVDCNLKKMEKYHILYFSGVDCALQELAYYMFKKGYEISYFYAYFSNIAPLFKEMKENSYNINRREEFQKYSRTLDKIIEKKNIKDCVLFVEDSRWITYIQYIKEKYNFKIIFYVNKDVLSKEEEKVFEMSDLVITTASPLYDKGKSNIILIESVEDIKIINERIINSINNMYKLVSIVIVTFNNLSYTKECIQSIFDKTAYPNYELIIVDNKSEDATIDYLEKLKKQYDHVKVILNEDNYGFAKGNNIGMKAAKGAYIILLNNDTVVTKGWISGLIKHLEKNPKLGIVGPVTNYVANEARINVSYTNMKEMDAFAQRYTVRNLNKLYKKVSKVIMFCVAIPKEVITRIGYLDENFEVGMFEDDDYSYRLKKSGYEIGFTRDVFIHHYGSATFKTLINQEMIRIYKKNKEIFREKWVTK